MFKTLTFFLKLLKQKKPLVAKISHEGTIARVTTQVHLGHTDLNLNSVPIDT